MERMSVGLPRVVKLDNFRAPIPDGYFSKLRFDNSDINRTPVTGLHPTASLWGTRQDNTVLQVSFTDHVIFQKNCESYGTGNFIILQHS